MPRASSNPQNTGYLLRTQGRALLALMLRDIRTRFFGHGLGFLLAIAWPLLHVLVLLGFYHALGRATPYGEDLLLFFATALGPFMAFSYLSRFAMLSVIQNRPLLNFPAIRPLDIVYARCILETLGSICMMIVLFGILWVLGVDIRPHDPVQAVYAFSSALLLGVCLGLLNAVITMAMPGWATVYSLMIVLLYLTSGVIFVPDTLPEQLRDIVVWNPALHSVEWMRQAYFPSYGKEALDKTYLFSFCLISLFAGLAIERLFRGYLVRLK